MPSRRAYTDDYTGWVEDTACAIEEGRFGEIDRAALADEIRDLGKTERREMRVQRADIAEFLEESPSLRRELPTLIARTYSKARLKVADETGLEVDTFPETCGWNGEEVLGK